MYEPLPKKINGRLKEIVMKRWGNPDFNKLSKKFYNSVYMGKYVNRYQWRTASGHLFYIEEMSKRHLVNTLNLLTGKAKKNPIPDEHFTVCVPDNLNRENWINVFLDELKKYV